MTERIAELTKRVWVALQVSVAVLSSWISLEKISSLTRRVWLLAMNFCVFLALCFAVISNVKAQTYDNYGRGPPSNTLAAPIKPIDPSTSSIFYPSEDTNMNRRPSHVSKQVRTSTHHTLITPTRLRVWQKAGNSQIIRNLFQERKPIEDARACYANELLYPGDNEGDWV